MPNYSSPPGSSVVTPGHGAFLVPACHAFLSPFLCWIPEQETDQLRVMSHRPSTVGSLAPARRVMPASSGAFLGAMNHATARRMPPGRSALAMPRGIRLGSPAMARGVLAPLAAEARADLRGRQLTPLARLRPFAAGILNVGGNFAIGHSSPPRLSPCTKSEAACTRCTSRPCPCPPACSDTPDWNW